MYVVPSPKMICHSLGLSPTSFCSMNGMPESMSTSRFSTMRPSNWIDLLSCVKINRVSPLTFSGEEPSAWWADCELLEMRPPNLVAVDNLIIFPVTPLWIVSRPSWW